MSLSQLDIQNLVSRYTEALEKGNIKLTNNIARELLVNNVELIFDSDGNLQGQYVINRDKQREGDRLDIDAKFVGLK